MSINYLFIRISNYRNRLMKIDSKSNVREVLSLFMQNQHNLVHYYKTIYHYLFKTNKKHYTHINNMAIIPNNIKTGVNIEEESPAGSYVAGHVNVVFTTLCALTVDISLAVLAAITISFDKTLSFI